MALCKSVLAEPGESLVAGPASGREGSLSLRWSGATGSVPLSSGPPERGSGRRELRFTKPRS